MVNNEFSFCNYKFVGLIATHNNNHTNVVGPYWKINNNILKKWLKDFDKKK